MSRPIEQRIMERVCKMPASEGGCWIWTGATTRGGYGAIKHNGRVEYVHRLIAAHYGFDVEGQTVDHICHTRTCVRMTHLMVCSAAENSRRAMSEGWRIAVAALVAEQNGMRAR